MTTRQYEKIIAHVLDSVDFAACLKKNNKILATNKLFEDAGILNMSDNEIQQNGFFVESINLVDDINIFIYKPDYVRKLNFTKNALKEAIELL